MTTHGHGPASPATRPATNEPRIRRRPASNEVLFLTIVQLGALVACKQRIDLRIERTPPATGRAAKVVFLHKEIFCHRCILKPETGIKGNASVQYSESQTDAVFVPVLDSKHKEVPENQTSCTFVRTANESGNML